MNPAPANSPALELTTPQPNHGWSPTRWLAVITLIFGTHVALIYLSGEKKQVNPRAVTNVPKLKIADNSDELIALNDPTLFVLPHQRDFANAVWLETPPVNPPTFRWTESPRWLPLPAENLGAAFQQFMRTNYFARPPLDFKPSPKFSTPVLPVKTPLAQNSMLQIVGKLAQRRLLNEINPPSLPDNDVIAPSVVQVLVDTAGNVVSAVLLTPSGLDAADQRALTLARTARFAPSASLTIGRMIFTWHTVPPNASP
jgi:TonB family protein